MKFKKIGVLIMSVLMIGSLSFSLTGCGKKTEKVDIVSEYTINDTVSYSVYLPKEDGKKVENEVLMEKLKSVVEKNGEGKKGVIVSFYEYENEGKFGDLTPYAVGTWGPKSGFDNVATLINTRNNVYKVEKNSSKDVEINDKTIEVYNKFLDEVKDSKLSFATTLSTYLVENGANIKEKYGVDQETFISYINNMITRYDTDGITKLKTGE